MQKGWMNKPVCLACWGLLAVLTAVGPSQTAVDSAQGGTPDMMDRVQRVDDPELAEIIRTALANHKNLSEKDSFGIVRQVTQSYAQIKLLDQQIQQVTRKIETTAGPAEVRDELLFAKKELELKRMTELANLREAMAVVPKFPFGKQPAPSRNIWLHLQVLDQRVLVLDSVKPFDDYWARGRRKVTGLLSEKETLDYVQGLFRDRKNLPMRIDIGYRPKTNGAAENLRNAIASMAREANADMDTDLRLELATWVGSGTSTFYLRQGKIITFYPTDGVERPDRGPKLLVSGVVDPNDLEQSILWRLTMPMNVPLTFRIEYDEASTKLAKQVADMAKEIAKRLGLSELVQVAGVLVEPVPETVFLGRWEALGKGQLQTVDIQSSGVCEVLVGEGSDAIKAGTRVKGIWLLSTREIYVDVNDKGRDAIHYVYRGSIDEAGRLVFQRGDIRPQGNFGGAGANMVLKAQ
jgi:hypothetical protein